MGNIVKVEMADLKFASAPDILTTIGLGSCVGAVIYDPIIKIAGLAHVMLPNVLNSQKEFNVAKYADTALPKVIEELERMGASRSRLLSKLAGGAQMFNFDQNSEILKIGQRNTAACKEILERYKIPVVAEDTGGNKGRTIEFYTETGTLLIKTIGFGTKEI